MAIMKKTTTHAGEDVGKTEILCSVGKNVNYPATMEISIEVPQKLK
jgi:hypothetical protein